MELTAKQEKQREKAFQKFKKKRIEELEEKARKKGWGSKSTSIMGGSDTPINMHLNKKDFDEWYNLKLRTRSNI